MLDVLQSRLDLTCQRHRIRRRLFLDTDDYHRLSIVTGFAAFHARRKVDGGNLVQENGLVVANDHYRMAQILQPLGQADVADQVFAAVLVDKSTARVRSKPRDRLLDLIMRNIECLHRRQIGRDAVLADFPADWNDLGDARQSKQLRTEHEVRHFADLHWRNRAIAAHSDQHDFAHNRGHGSYLRVDRARQLLADEGETLGHKLPGAINVHAPIELDVHQG